MTIWQAIILGIIQGLTEFIPVSSTAHLTLCGKLMGLIDPQNPQKWTAFIAVMQLGTLAAVIVYFTSDLIAITRGFVLFNLSLATRRKIDEQVARSGRLGWFIIIGTLPIGIAGFAFKDIIEGALTKNLWVITSSLIGLAAVLTVAEMIGPRRRDLAQLGIADAVVVGVSQVFALIPGSSRSGVTITGGLFSGLTRDAAARFSFLLAIPAIGASGLFELPSALKSVQSDWTALITATIVSGIFGYLAIAFLIRYLRTHSTFLFVVYRVVLGFLLAILMWRGLVDAD